MSTLEEVLARMKDTDLRTIHNELGGLRGAPLREPRKKKRKTDIRTIRKRWRLAKRERADEWRHSQGTLKAQYHKLRREVKRRRLKTVRAESEASWEWELKLHEWVNMWGSCPAIEVGMNVWKPAWLCRGRDRSKDVQLKRKDIYKSWCLSNLLIVKGKEVLFDCEEAIE